MLGLGLRRGASLRGHLSGARHLARTLVAGVVLPHPLCWTTAGWQVVVALAWPAMGHADGDIWC